MICSSHLIFGYASQLQWAKLPVACITTDVMATIQITTGV